MRADFALAQTLRQLVRHAFDQTARVDEDQRRVVRLNLRHELIVDRGQISWRIIGPSSSSGTSI